VISLDSSEEDELVLNPFSLYDLYTIFEFSQNNNIDKNGNLIV
jgi:hypothetical protein